MLTKFSGRILLVFHLILLDIALSFSNGLLEVDYIELYQETENWDINFDTLNGTRSYSLTRLDTFKSSNEVALKWNSVFLAKILEPFQLQKFLSTIANYSAQVHHLASIVILPVDSQFLDKVLWNSSTSALTGLRLNHYVYFCELSSFAEGKLLIDLLDELSLNSCFETYTIKNKVIKNQVGMKVDVKGTFELAELLVGRSTRREDFHGALIKASVYEYLVSMGFNSFTRQGEDPSFVNLEDGLEVEIFFCLRDALNFTYKAKLSEGFLVEGGNKTLLNFGMAELLNSEVTDVSLSFGEYIPYRMRGPFGIRYLHSTYHSPVQAFFVQPSLHSMKNKLFMPFTLDLWVTIGILIISICLMVWSFSCIMTMERESVNYKWNSGASKRAKMLLKSINSNIILWMSSTISQKSYSNGNESSVQRNPIQSTKIILFTTMIASQIIYVGYTSAMYSIITVPSLPIRTYNDLQKVSFDIYLDKFVPTIRNSLTWLKERNLLPPHISSAKDITKQEAIPMILTSQSAMISTSDEFMSAFKRLNYTDDVICRKKIHQVPVDRANIIGGMFVKRGSPFRDIFNTKLLLIRERGLEKRNLLRYFRISTIQCMEKGETVFSSIKFQDVATGFILLFIAFFVSWIMLLYEVKGTRYKTAGFTHKYNLTYVY